MGVLAKSIGPAVGYDEFGRTVCRNDSGVNISKGQFVYISGVSHVSTKDDMLPEVTLADADAAGGAYGRLKIAAEDVDNGKTGTFVDYLMANPSTLPTGGAGTDLWLSTTAGGYSETKPSTGKVRKVGEVLVKGATAAASVVFLNVLGWLDLDDSDAGALAVGESRFLTADTIAHDDASPKTLFTVPAGQVWRVSGELFEVSEAWDGTGADVDVGISGGDTDGFVDGSATSSPDFTTLGFYCDNPTERGALLFDATVGDLDGESPIREYIIDASGGAVSVIATITPGSGASTGEAIASFDVTRVK